MMCRSQHGHVEPARFFVESHVTRCLADQPPIDQASVSLAHALLLPLPIHLRLL